MSGAFLFGVLTMDLWQRYKWHMTKSLPYPEIWIAAVLVVAFLVVGFLVDARPRLPMEFIND